MAQLCWHRCPIPSFYRLLGLLLDFFFGQSRAMHHVREAAVASEPTVQTLLVCLHRHSVRAGKRLQWGRSAVSQRLQVAERDRLGDLCRVLFSPPEAYL